ncbi:MAG: hypothetical protein GAK28_02622 [Luteibacter sp.]|uniref:ABC transporter permease n=1 Tax=Luteibacter sp. TaxID=1886636 RepID=UPI00138059DB|nr:ABC transporter permease [Luteibacter sp.]KAF1006311.1 MAG: hypothetical protein GAK28_02622 [Luteibacter sp.]
MSSRLPDLVGRLRGLFRRPTYLLVASLTLGLGVAAMVCAFIPVNALLLRPPPFPHHDRVVFYGSSAPLRVISPRLYELIGRPAGVISTGVARTVESVNARLGESILLLRAQRVDPDFLPTLGIHLIAGQPLSGADDEAIVSWRLWKAALGGGPEVIGRAIEVNGKPFHIRGVLPPDYRFREDADLLLPLHPNGPISNLTSNLMAVAWLSPDASVESLATHVRTVASRHAVELHISENRLAGFGASTLSAQITVSARPLLLLFLGCGVLVISIAGLNLSALMLVRTMSRSREVALRVALGARGYRLWLPGLGEAAVIATLTVIVGLQLGGLLAGIYTRFLLDDWFAPESLSHINWRVHVFAIIVTAIVLALAMLGDPMKARSADLLGHRSHHFLPGAGIGRRTRQVVTLAQTALATMLLVLSVGMIARWWNLDRVPVGFKAKDALVFDIAPDAGQYLTVSDVATLFEKLRQRLHALPGVTSVGMSSLLPISGRFVMPFADANGLIHQVQYGVVTPGAIDAMGVSLVLGRQFDEVENVPVALVNQAYVRAFGQDSVVRPALLGAHDAPPPIVGVVEDTRQSGPDREPPPAVFVLLSQVPESTFDNIRTYLSMHVFLRGTHMNRPDRKMIDDLVHEVAPQLAVANVRSLQADVDRMMDASLRDAAFSTAFAMVALILACIGLYSSQSVDVAMRRSDFAMMSALGATPADVLGVVLSQGCGSAFAGVASGLVLAAWLSGRGWLERITDWRIVDAGVVASVSIAMIVLTLGAVGIPAVRASRIDPLHVIR